MVFAPIRIGYVRRFLWRLHAAREALPDAIALARSVCRVRSPVGQDSNLVVRRIISDTIGILSPDPTQAQLWHRRAAFAFIAATPRNAEYRRAALAFIAAIHLHLALLIRHRASALHHLGFAI